MIPKVIHYCWFSGEPFPPEVEACLASWREFLPDFSFRLWDRESLYGFESDYLKEALIKRRWAFAADYVRLYALYNFGGVYLDSDVQLYQSLAPLLQHTAFIGKESSIHFDGPRSSQYLTSHCLGAEKGHPFIKDCLDFYDDRRFVHSNNEHLPPSLRFDSFILPYVQSEIARLYGYDDRPSVQEIQQCKEGLVIYPSRYFDATNITDETICRHLALGSWRYRKSPEPTYNLRYKIEWRIVALLERLLRHHHYVLRKID